MRGADVCMFVCVFGRAFFKSGYAMLLFFVAVVEISQNEKCNLLRLIDVYSAKVSLLLDNFLTEAGL